MAPKFYRSEKHVMQRTLIFPLIYVLATTFVYAQQRIEKCSLPVVTKIKSNMKDLVAEDVRDFLLTFDQICLSDTEYTVNSNELLFMMLDQYPELLLKSMYEYRSQVDLRSIFYQFSHPANAKYNIEPLVEKIRQASSHGSINEQMITELQRIPK
jgi:hypothetical protein